MKLATAQDVTTRMGTNTSQGNIGTAADSALEGVTTVIENIIGTPLANVERLDWFDYLPSAFDTSVGFIVNLTQAFIDGDVKLYASTDGYPVLPDFSNASQYEASYYDVDENLGILTLFTNPMEGRSTLAAKYSAGFVEGDADIPEWLKQAAISGAIRIIHSQTLGHNKDDISKTAPELHRIMSMDLSNYIRPRLSGAFPTRTRVL